MIKEGDLRTIVSEGMPFHHNPMQKGNMHIKFSVEMPTPTDITPDVCKALEALLPPRPDAIMVTPEMDEVSLRCCVSACFEAKRLCKRGEVRNCKREDLRGRMRVSRRDRKCVRGKL